MTLANASRQTPHLKGKALNSAIDDIITYLFQKYRALNGKHTDSIYDLEIPVSLLSGVCVQVPSITLPQGDLEPAFQVDVVSNIASSSGTAHIRQDRYVWFD